MSASVVRPLPYAAESASIATPARVDSGARLATAILGYLLLLIGALTLMPFAFERPAVFRVVLGWTPRDVLLNVALFVPVGFVARRAWRGHGDRLGIGVVLLAAATSVTIELLQLFEVSRFASPWDVASNVAGAVLGAGILELVARRHAGEDELTTDVLLLQLPLMGLVYLLVPLLWVSGMAAEGDPPRLVLTMLVGLTGASILGSVARAMAPMTYDRSWWSVPVAAMAWATVGLMPAVQLDWRLVALAVVATGIHAGWRGRLSAPPFQERRFEVPALVAATPFLACFLVGSAIWPARGFRTIPLWHFGFPTADGGLALVLPVIEALVGTTVLGYVIAEFQGRREYGFRTAWPRVVRWALAILVGGEALRSVLAYEGASVLRLVLSFACCVYGAWLYHLQREHVKVVARRRREAAAARDMGRVAA
jgi:hypothetical protein